MGLPKRVPEKRAEHLLAEILQAQGWDLRRPPQGDLVRQQDYRSFPRLADVLRGSQGSGTPKASSNFPYAILVDRASGAPLAIIEVRADTADLGRAVDEAANVYGNPCVTAGHFPLAIGLAGTSEEDFDLRVTKWSGAQWTTVTYDGKPITWIPNRVDLESVAAPSGGWISRLGIKPPLLRRSSA